MDRRGACFELHTGYSAFTANPAPNFDVNHHPNLNSDADTDSDANSNLNLNLNPDANSLASRGFYP